MADEVRDYADWRAEKLADPEIRAEFDALGAMIGIAKVLPRYARHFQEQAEMCSELMRLSGATREEIQHHVSHSVYSLRDLLSMYKATGIWACCRDG